MNMLEPVPNNKESIRPFPLHLGFLASHNGTDMKGIIDALQSHTVQGQACVLISNNSGSGAMSFAQDIGLPNYHISDKTYSSPERKDEAICNTLLMHDVNIVILSGYMKKLGPQTRAQFPGRILNVHPALLPKYKGLWGDNVHEAVLAAGEPITGVTIHGVTDTYDEGPILWQSQVTVKENDTVLTLKERVQKEEINAFVQLLQQIHKGQIILM